ncbi:unnamed protein product [Lactuca saligna]|uniref:AP2/ERF domain-containing protein n=1 Tax=Lactuca saligna TaxID=75948 RepID=A0AA36A0L3_LACSI|nr:unnamed protein product [Lactuca saligna]
MRKGIGDCSRIAAVQSCRLKNRRSAVSSSVPAQRESAQLGSSSNVNCSSSSGGNVTAETEVKLASLTPKKRAGRKKFIETRHPVYRGVRMRDNGKWVCELREPNTQFRVWLGTHPTAVMAARAHDVAVLAFRGPSATLNFANLVSRLPIPKYNSIVDIQKAAAEDVEAFRYAEDTMENVETKESSEVDQVYEDEEEIFEMPGFFASMAEGLMVPPPQTVGYGNDEDNVEFCTDDSLWSP